MTTDHSPTSTAHFYEPRRPGVGQYVAIRGLPYHVHTWGEASMATPERPALFMLHGWMDVGASFQFLVDELSALGGPDRFIVAPDWRGFGLTRPAAGASIDTYWFPDYLADLEALMAALWPAANHAAPIDLLGHSMGGNVAMLYAGVRPQRIRKLVNLEGFGMPDTPPTAAPVRYRRWLDELADRATLQPYASLEAVAARMRRNDPLLTAERAAWLARHWASETSPGTWQLRADPAHKQSPPTLYRKDEVLNIWREITAPMLWIEGDLTDVRKFWGTRYSKADFHERLTCVPDVRKHVVAPSGHMLHHDQPDQVARLVETFLAGA